MDKPVEIDQQKVDKVIKTVKDHKKLFILRALKLESLLHDKSPTFKDGLAKGYTQGVIDTLKLLGLYEMR